MEVMSVETVKIKALEGFNILLNLMELAMKNIKKGTSKIPKT
jgi:hypothetical protein